MAEDFKINIGVTGDSAGVSGTKGEDAMAGGVSKGLKVAGVIGFLSSLTVVTNVIGIALGLIQVGVVSLVGFLGGLFGQFLLKVVPFFEDPLRSLLQFGVFLINGIITGIEFGLNKVVDAINLVIRGINFLIPGTGFDIPTMGNFELPRFQEALVLKAYDDYKETIVELAGEGKSLSVESLMATSKFIVDLGKSFMRTSDYQEMLNEQIQKSQENATGGIDSINSLADAITAGSGASLTNFGTAFSSMDKVAQEMKRRSEQLIRSFGGSSSGSSTSSSSLTSSQNAINNALMQSTTLTDAQASAGLYLLNRLSGA